MNLFLLALNLISASYADPASTVLHWVPGAVVVRCDQSDWHILEAWNFKGFTQVQSTNTTTDQWLRQFANFHGPLARKISGAAALQNDYGDFDLGGAPALDIPSNCESRLVTKILYDPISLTPRIYQDKKTLTLLPASEQALVRLRTTFSSTITNPYSSDAIMAFRGLVSGKLPTDTIQAWVSIQKNLGFTRFILNGLPLQFYSSDGGADSYYFGFSDDYDDTNEPYSLFGFTFYGTYGTRFSCDLSMDPTQITPENFFKHCTFSGRLKNPDKLDDFFGLITHFSSEGEFSLNIYPDGLTLVPQAYSKVHGVFNIPSQDPIEGDINGVHFDQNGKIKEISVRASGPITIYRDPSHPFLIRSTAPITEEVSSYNNLPVYKLESRDAGGISVSFADFNLTRIETLRLELDSKTAHITLNHFSGDLNSISQMNQFSFSCSNYQDADFYWGSESFAFNSVVCSSGTVKGNGSPLFTTYTGYFFLSRTINQEIILETDRFQPEISYNADIPGTFKLINPPREFTSFNLDQQQGETHINNDYYDGAKTSLELFGQHLELQSIDLGFDNKTKTAKTTATVQGKRGVNHLKVPGHGLLPYSELTVTADTSQKDLTLDVTLAAAIFARCPSGKVVHIPRSEYESTNYFTWNKKNGLRISETDELYSSHCAKKAE